MSTRYKRSPYTAKTVLRQQSLRAATLTEVYRTVQHEIHSICMRKYGNSVLRLLRNASNSSKVCNFSWVELLKEFKTKAPTLMSFVRAALARRGRKVPRYAVGACECSPEEQEQESSPRSSSDIHCYVCWPLCEAGKFSIKLQLISLNISVLLI